MSGKPTPTNTTPTGSTGAGSQRGNAAQHRTQLQRQSGDDFEAGGMTLPVGRPIALPPELEPIREAARRVILPIKPVTSATEAEKNFLFTARMTNAGRKLPPYYLVYFLFVDLLGFPNLGRSEKLAWSVPIDFDGVAYLIEHRKFDVGVLRAKVTSGSFNPHRLLLSSTAASGRQSRSSSGWLRRRFVHQS
jgi:hypothetical protein